MDNDCPGLLDEAHPELFATIPPQPAQLKAGQLSEDKVKQFYDEGFLIVDSFFTPEELNPSKDALSDMVEDVAQRLYKAGKIKNLYSEYPFESRLTMIEKEFPGANVVLYKSGAQPKAVSELWANERLVNVAEQLLGTTDVDGLPSWNFRPKLPKSDTTVIPWHQDTGYFDNSTYRSLIITAWIPLVDANKETGCLQMARYAHKKGKVARHTGCFRDTWFLELEEEEMTSTLGVDHEKDVVTCEVPYGGVLFFTSFTPHRGIPNVSNIIRWSFDFRWQAAGLPAGYYGLKQSVRMRSSTDPDMKINWEPFLAVDRRKNTYKLMNSEQNEFDTTNPGPWMVKWPMLNENCHTKAVATVNRTQWKTMIDG